MSDLRAILGDKYDATIEKVLEAIAREVDYLPDALLIAAAVNALPDLLDDGGRGVT